MHHRGQLMTMERMNGHRAAPHARRCRSAWPQMAARRPQGADMAAPSPRFSADTLRFLRALKRNNRREWFNAHRDDYEAYVRQPMIAIVERLADDLRAFAPELVASPKVSMYRIYRDTRFSENKTPYKTHVAARFPTARPAQGRRRRACTFTSRRTSVWIGGGMYAPQPRAALRASASTSPRHLKQFRAIVESPRFKKHLGALEGDRLQRVPRGFPKERSRGGVPEVPAVHRRRRVSAPRWRPARRSTGRCSRSSARSRPSTRFLNAPLLKG